MRVLVAVYRVRAWAEIAIGLSWAVAMGIAGWLWLDKGPVFIEPADPVALTPAVHAGEILRVQRNFCLLREVQGTVSYVLVQRFNGARIVPIGDPRPQGNRVGCFPKQIFDIRVPRWVEPGDYEYRVRVTYWLNPLRQWTDEARPVRVTILPPRLGPTDSGGAP